MIRLEIENANTIEFYTEVLTKHLILNGLDDTKDRWRLDKLLSNYNGGKLLDMGCGISMLPLIAYEKDMVRNEVWALDFAKYFIEIMSFLMWRIGKEKVHYIAGNVDNLPFGDNFFDYVVLGEVIEHVEDPRTVISEARRVLKKGGLIALSTPHNETMATHQDKQHLWSYALDDIKELMDVREIEVIGNNIIAFGT